MEKNVAHSPSKIILDENYSFIYSLGRIWGGKNGFSDGSVVFGNGNPKTSWNNRTNNATVSRNNNNNYSRTVDVQLSSHFINLCAAVHRAIKHLDIGSHSRFQLAL